MKISLSYTLTVRLQIRCSGQPTGCDRCSSTEAECWYPDRSARRKKRPSSLRSVTPEESNKSGNSNVSVTDNRVRGEPEQGKEGQNRIRQSEDDGRSKGIQQNDFQPFKYNSSRESITDGRNDLMDLDVLSNPMLASQLEDIFGTLDGSTNLLWGSPHGSDNRQPGS